MLQVLDYHLIFLTFEFLYIENVHVHVHVKRVVLADDGGA